VYLYHVGVLFAVNRLLDPLGRDVDWTTVHHNCQRLVADHACNHMAQLCFCGGPVYSEPSSPRVSQDFRAIPPAKEVLLICRLFGAVLFRVAVLFRIELMTRTDARF
jgi:hypothetical protein